VSASKTRSTSVGLVVLLALVPTIAGTTGGHAGERDELEAAQTSTLSTLSSHAMKQLRDKLNSRSPVSLQVVDADGAPLEIKDAKVSSIRIEGNYDAPPTPVSMVNDYVMKLSVRLVNRTDRRVDGFGLELTNLQVNDTFFVYPRAGEIGAGKSSKVEIPFMAVTGDPASLSVQLAGARFHDGLTWRGFPFPVSRFPSAHARPPTTSPAMPPAVAPTKPQATAPTTTIDSKPRPLNAPMPRYTEEARKNCVQGGVRLRVLVGSDGTVKQVKVTHALPDWLTEEAIRAAYEIRFEPARKDGKPVAYWVPVEVEFNLK
jgi:TonB family protein